MIELYFIQIVKENEEHCKQIRLPNINKPYLQNLQGEQRKRCRPINSKGKVPIV